MRRGCTPRVLARALRAWLACTILALTCAPPALERARAQVVMVSEATAEREEPSAEQCRVERSRPSEPRLAQGLPRIVRRSGVRPRAQVLHAPPRYLEHCALLL